jgi:glycosyltransferase involved in cell wall biosynthesis
MKIFIPTILSTKRTVGVAEYLVNLIKYLQKIDTENEYYILTTVQNSYMFDLKNKNFHEIKIHVYDFSRMFLRLNYFAWQLFYFKRLIKTLNIDIIHFPCPWFIPKNLKSITTVHDMTEFHIRKYNTINNYIKREMIKWTFKNSSDIIVVSQNTYEDVIGYFQGNVYTIYNGGGELNEKVFRSDTLLKKHNLVSKNYFVFIGTLQKHKNINNLIEAYNIFILSNLSLTIKLVLIGKKDNALNDIHKKIEEYSIQNYVQILGYMPEEEKNKILQEAFCLLYPSLYEGFGFPILDAQSRGIPVITSNISSMPEISGEGALLIDPVNHECIAKAMSDLVQNNDLRSELINKGFKNIKRFSWARCAEQTLKVYKKTFTNS